MSDTHNLDEAILDSELRSINFFNGRLLSAEDLSQEQTVNRARSRHLGMALGAGVVFGLEVSSKGGADASLGLVEIAAGLAVNPAGQTLRLKCSETVALVTPPDPSEASECLFADCAPSTSGTTASAEGYYVLTIAPASRRTELAPVSGLGNRLADCNSKYYSEGVRFRFLRLQTDATGATARNAIAYDCLGHPNVTSAFEAAMVTGAAPDYGVATQVAAGELTDEDVPLAVVEWKTTGELGFVDLWSVRRRLTHRPAEGRWSFFISDRRRSETEAMMLQFQEQIRSIQAESGATAVTAADRFALLPPAGILPVHARLAEWHTFLGLPSYWYATPIQPGQIRSLLVEAMDSEPLALADLASSINVYSITGRAEVIFTRRRPGSYSYYE